VTAGSAPTREGRSRWLAFRVVVVDRVVALALLPILGPVMAVLAWLVRREDGPPSFIALDRVGEGGRTFRMWKLRSMSIGGVGGTAGGAVITSVSDDRITRIGRHLRRWRLDELPQVANVLRGDMGLLGPRPETPTLVDRSDSMWDAVLAIRPGITGPTQLVVERWEAASLDEGSQEDRYRDVILPVKLAVDRWYVEQSSPLVDLAVAWSMVQRFVLGRAETVVERTVRTHVPAAREVPHL